MGKCGAEKREQGSQHRSLASCFGHVQSIYNCRQVKGEYTIPGGHADSFATSLALYLRPEAVRVTQIFNPHSKPVDWDDPNLDFARYSSTGVIGDPTHASAALGAKLWEAVVDAVALILKEIAETT